MARRATIGVLSLAALLGAGCGISDPYNDRDRGATEQQPRQEREAAQPLPPGGTTAATPEDAVSRVALAWGNWTSETLHRQHRLAIALAVDPAAKRLKQESRQIEDGVVSAPQPLRSRATVEAITLRGSGARRKAIVVTRENLTGAGPLGSVGEYAVTLAVVERRGKGWVISTWNRQP